MFFPCCHLAYLQWKLQPIPKRRLVAVNDLTELDTFSQRGTSTITPQLDPDRYPHHHRHDDQHDRTHLEFSQHYRRHQEFDGHSYEPRRHDDPPQQPSLSAHADGYSPLHVMTTTTFGDSYQTHPIEQGRPRHHNAVQLCCHCGGMAACVCPLCCVALYCSQQCQLRVSHSHGSLCIAVSCHCSWPR